MVLLNQFELVLQRPLASTFHVPLAAWSAGASRMELAAIEDRNRLDSLFFMDCFSWIVFMDFLGLFNLEF
jgi:hypothetical protein